MSPLVELIPPLLRPMPEGWTLRSRNASDARSVLRLQRSIGDHLFHFCLWNEALFSAQSSAFPSGQLVLLDAQSKCIGFATCLKVAPKVALFEHTWCSLTGSGSLATHDPSGAALYVAGLSIDPDFQGMGLTQHLWRACLEVASEEGCTRLVTASRMPDYSTASEYMTPEGFLALAQKGVVFDSVLSKNLRMGFRPQGILREYAPDPDSENNAALLVMDGQAFMSA